MKEKLLSLNIPGYGKVDTPENIPSGVQSQSLVTAALSIALIIGIIMSLFYLIYGGIFWLQSGGDKTKLDKARRTIIYAVVGLIVMSLALLIVNVILAALGIKSPFAK